MPDVFVRENFWLAPTQVWKGLCVVLRVCGKLALAELTGGKWPDVESLLVAGPVRRDMGAATNSEEEISMLRAHC